MAYENILLNPATGDKTVAMVTDDGTGGQAGQSSRIENYLGFPIGISGESLASKAFAQAMHGLTITPQDEPGILIETTWDNAGEIDRISFLAEVVGGQQKITKILPKLGK